MWAAETFESALTGPFPVPLSQQGLNNVCETSKVQSAEWGAPCGAYLKAGP